MQTTAAREQLMAWLVRKFMCPLLAIRARAVFQECAGGFPERFELVDAIACFVPDLPDDLRD